MNSNCKKKNTKRRYIIIYQTMNLNRTKKGSVTHKNHLDDEIILIGTLKSVVLCKKTHMRNNYSDFITVHFVSFNSSVPSEMLLCNKPKIFKANMWINSLFYYCLLHLWRLPRTHVVEPVSDLLVNLVADGHSHGQEDFRDKSGDAGQLLNLHHYLLPVQYKKG